ncbi:hypothetical protein ACFYPN_32420 [Streptomyces sp. NPDC005576]|uniref:hypothetical protein n=1 Tax=Streptomyces sp. NPDC005576 TaxID=3364726 RepID=UPI003688E54D
MPVSTNLVPASVTAVSGLATVMAGAPWWGVIICLILSLAATSVQNLFPQDSPDRLTWWTNHRAHRHLRRTQRRRNTPPALPHDQP